MIDTRLLGSGALSAMALMLFAAASPASAAPQITPDMMIAPDSGAAPISAPRGAGSDVAALQERGRGGGGGRGEARSGGGRSWGGSAGRSGNAGGWNGGQRSTGSTSAERGGGRSWGGGAAVRSGDAASTASSGRRGSYDRGARSYAGNSGANTGNSGNYTGSSRNYAAPGNVRSDNDRRSGGMRERAAINRGDVQAPPSYGEGNRTGAASPYVRTDNLAAQGVNVAGSGGASGAGNAANLSDGRSGRGGRGEWSGNRGSGGPRGDVRGGNRGGDWNGAGRRDNWRGDNDRRGNWAEGRNNRRGNDGWRGDRRGNDRWRGNNRNNWRGNDWRGGRQSGYNQGFRDGLRWDRGWRDNRRFNWIGHRQANRFLFTPGPYFSPFAGHFYRPVGIGFFLDPLFFQPRFFLNDPWAFRLPPPGDRFRWVRYYDDVLLVDIFTGEVVDVIENFFW